MNKFGDLIRNKREEKEMLLRHLAAELDIDTAQLSKMERGERVTKKEQVKKLIDIFDLDNKEAKGYWLADQVYSVIDGEDEAIFALQVVKKEMLKLQ